MDNVSTGRLETAGCTTNTTYIMHESEVARLERINKRFWILILVLVILLVATNGVWIWYESQWEVVHTTVTQENGEGINNYIGNDGDIIYGTADGNNQKPNS